MARQAAGASRLPLHSHRRVVDESNRDLERYHHPEGDPVRHVQLRERAKQGDRVVRRALEQRLWTHRMDGLRDEIIDRVRTVTSRMEALLHATEIDDVAGRVA